MNTTTNGTEEVERYVDAVRAQLRDLPASDAAELLDDLRQHLAEVASEDDAPLADRLGPPERYAEELRVSAGLPASGQGATGVRNLWSAAVRRATAHVDHWLGKTWLAALRESGMVWFIARGYAMALAWGVITTWHSGLSEFPLPSIGGNPTFSLFVMAGLITVSVAIGERGRRGRRRFDVLLNLLLVLLGVWAMMDLREEGLRYETAEATEAALPAEPEGALMRHDGSRITNLYPYDSQGRPLENVLLYDQDGRPMELLVSYAPDGRPVFTSYPLDRDGRPVMNAYPQNQNTRTESFDGAGSETWGSTPSPRVPTLQGADPSPSPAPSGSPPSTTAPHPPAAN